MSRAPSVVIWILSVSSVEKINFLEALVPITKVPSEIIVCPSACRLCSESISLRTALLKLNPKEPSRIWSAAPSPDICDVDVCVCIIAICYSLIPGISLPKLPPNFSYINFILFKSLITSSTASYH